MDLELPILEELVKHQSTKIIYVVTHCNPNMDDVDKEDEIIKIQEGIQGITKNKDIYIVKQQKVACYIHLLIMLFL